MAAFQVMTPAMADTERMRPRVTREMVGSGVLARARDAGEPEEERRACEVSIGGQCLSRTTVGPWA